MQRMIVVLVLLLLVGFAGLGMAYLELSSQVEASSARVGTEPDRRAVTSETVADRRRIDQLEGELAAARRALAGVKGEIGSLRAELAAARRARAANPEDGSEPPPEIYAAPGERVRDMDGAFVITEEDEAYYLAVQKRIEKRRRIDGQTRNLMRRIDALSRRGEIAAVPETVQPEVERIIRGFVVGGDELVTDFIREPTETAAALTAEQRRDKMREERDALQKQALTALSEYLGQADAEKISEATLARPWGARIGRNPDRTRRR